MRLGREAEPGKKEGGPEFGYQLLGGVGATRKARHEAAVKPMLGPSPVHQFVRQGCPAAIRSVEAVAIGHGDLVAGGQIAGRLTRTDDRAGGGDELVEG